MSGTTTQPTNSARIEVLALVADGRRRRALSTLLDRGTPASERDLAAAVASSEGEEGPDETLDRVLAELRHVHLPALAEAGLVARDREAATVSTTDHPALSDPRFREILRTAADRWDSVVDCLADARRHAVLATLAGRDGPVASDALAGELFARTPEGPTAPGAIGEVAAALHHVHLPKLADAGLVAYDPDAGVVAYEGHPELAPELLEPRPGVPWIDAAADDAASTAVHGAE